MSDDDSKVLLLVVDDDAGVLELITAILEDGGYDTVHSGSAEEAFAVLQRQTRDLVGVVTDVNLGKGRPSGWDIARRARELSPKMPILYITGDSAHDWRALGVPHSALLQKPFAAAELVSAISHLRNTH